MVSRRKLFSLLLVPLCKALSGTVRPVVARAYRVDAAIVLFGRPVASRAGVGEAILMHEESVAPSGERVLHLAFAGGSRPERARGLNRFGYFGELIHTSRHRQASYFGFMTASDEKSLAEAARSLDRSGHSTALAAIRGEVRAESHVCIQTTLRLGGEACWTGWRSCLTAAAGLLHSGGPQPVEEHAGPATAGSTFLHTIAELLAECEGASQGRRPFLYGKTERWLRWSSARDRGTEEELRNRGVVLGGAEVWRLDAAIEARGSTARSRFRLWHAPGIQPPLPLRLELEARSFLRLRFEVLPGDSPTVEEEMRAALASWRPVESGIAVAGG